MHIKPAVGSVVGPGDDTHWGQVLLLPHAYGVIEVATDHGNARHVGIRILTKLTHRLGGPPLDIAGLRAIVSEAWEEGVQTLLVLVPVGNIASVVLRGSGIVYLKRRDLLATLLETDGAVSGEIQEGDMLLLASSQFTQTLTKEELAQTFDHLSASQAAEKLTLKLHEKTDGSGAAALLFHATETVSDVEKQEEGNQTVVAQPTPGVARFGRHHAWRGIRHMLAKPAWPRISIPRGWFSLSWRSPKSFLPLVIALLVGLFVVSVIAGLKKQASLAKTELVAKALADGQRGFDEGVALLPLNAIKGREKLAEVKAALEPLLSQVPERSKEGRQLRSFYQQVADNLAQSMQVVRAEPQLFYDVSLLKKAAQVTTMALENDTLALIDQPGATLYQVTISSKNGQIIAGGDTLRGASQVTLHGDRIYTLVDSGIHMVRTTDKKTTPTIVKKDTNWGTIVSMVSFGGNLYLLDSQKSRIWKYVATETGFSETREYLNPDTLPDLSRATGMAIDGSLWVGTADGRIFRFTQGKENTFIPKGVEPGLGSMLLVYTDDTMKNVYVLDTQNKRVVVLDKEGVYVAQYVWQQGIAVTGLVVSESQKKILVLADAKVYALDLK